MDWQHVTTGAAAWHDGLTGRGPRAVPPFHSVSQRIDGNVQRQSLAVVRTNPTPGVATIVHGKGTRSQDRIPVLKRMVPRWLSTKRLSSCVVAYTSAAPTDGGVGATYVLLRKVQGRPGKNPE